MQGRNKIYNCLIQRHNEKVVQYNNFTERMTAMMAMMEMVAGAYFDEYSRIRIIANKINF